MSETISNAFKNFLILLGRAGRKTVLRPREAILLIRMAAWILILSASLKLASLPRVLQLISVKVKRPQVTGDPSTRIRLARAIDLLLSANWFVFRPSCWRRAIILHRYLALYGIESRINFGVKRDSDGTLAGHAWLEHQGEPILEGAALHYKVTFGFPGEGVLPSEPVLPPEIQRT